MEYPDILRVKVRSEIGSILRKHIDAYNYNSGFYEIKDDRGIFSSIYSQTKEKYNSILSSGRPALYLVCLTATMFSLGATIARIQVNSGKTLFDFSNEDIQNELDTLFSSSDPERFKVAFGNSTLPDDTETFTKVLMKYVTTVMKNHPDVAQDEECVCCIAYVAYNAGASIFLSRNRNNAAFPTVELMYFSS